MIISPKDPWVNLLSILLFFQFPLSTLMNLINCFIYRNLLQWWRHRLKSWKVWNSGIPSIWVIALISIYIVFVCANFYYGPEVLGIFDSSRLVRESWSRNRIYILYQIQDPLDRLWIHNFVRYESTTLSSCWMMGMCLLPTWRPTICWW